MESGNVRPNSRLEIFSTCPPIGNTPLAYTPRLYLKQLAGVKMGIHWGYWSTPHSHVDPGWFPGNRPRGRSIGPLSRCSHLTASLYSRKDDLLRWRFVRRRINLNLVARGGFKNDLVCAKRILQQTRTMSGTSRGRIRDDRSRPAGRYTAITFQR